jgi:hypothetical protein
MKGVRFDHRLYLRFKPNIKRNIFFREGACKRKGEDDEGKGVTIKRTEMITKKRRGNNDEENKG